MNQISVIIPTYNRKHCLARAIDSVLTQTHLPLELIVVDDGSTDQTPAFIQECYPKVKLLQQAHQGVSAARNLGISQAQGEWIALLDSDDAWCPKKLERQWQALSAEPDYLICHCDEIWIRHGKRVNPMNKHQKYGGFIFQKCLEGCLISPSNVLIHQSIFQRVGLFNESLPACEDYDLWLKITAIFPVLYLEDPLSIRYGGHDDQLSKQYWGMDRFRIQSLQALIDARCLQASDQQAALAVLCRKISIYLTGAKKRGKQKDIHYYETLLTQYTPKCQA